MCVSYANFLEDTRDEKNILCQFGVFSIVLDNQILSFRTSLCNDRQKYVLVGFNCRPKELTI